MAGKNKQVWRRRIAWLILLLYWPTAFLATHISPQHLRRLEFQGHSLLLHALAYFTLTLAFWVACYGFRRPPSLRKRQTWLVLALMLGYAAFDEISQALVQRHPSLIDWFADAAGTILALVLLFIFRRVWYWLLIYWVGFALFRHLPQRAEIISLAPEHFLRYSAAYLLLAYVPLTLLWTRSLSPPARWVVDGRIAGFTVTCLGLYAALDVWLADLGRFDGLDFTGALLGIGIGLVVSAAFADGFAAKSDDTAKAQGD